MSTAAAVVFISLALLAYIYVGYPAWTALRARLFPKPIRRGPFNGRYSVLIACFNEAETILAKVESLLNQTVADQMDQILIGVDGATDATAEIARSIGDSRVSVHVFESRRGKPAVINDLLQHVRSEIVVMTDARQRVEKTAVARLLACLHDPTVGVVSGELVFEQAEGTATAQGMGLYWNYEKWIRNNEGLAASVPGATGALYAIRRSLLKPIPSNTLLDDVAYPMQAVMAGTRCVFESGAVVFDRPSCDPRQEAIRKRRTIAGVFQLMRLYPGWLRPLKNPIWGAYVSHKVLRLASPWLLALTFAGSVVLSVASPGWRYMLAAQVLFYVSAAVGWLSGGGGVRTRIMSGPMMFVALNLTTLAATWDAIWGRYHVVWRRFQGTG